MATFMSNIMKDKYYQIQTQGRNQNCWFLSTIQNLGL